MKMKHGSMGKEGGKVHGGGIPGGDLTYAVRGQMTVQGQAHKGKAGITMGTGIYPKPPVGPGKHSSKSMSSKSPYKSSY